MDKSRRIEIYDTTLRDGTQGEGFSLSLQDKLLVAQKLDELGVDYIEGGFFTAEAQRTQRNSNHSGFPLRPLRLCGESKPFESSGS